MNVYDSARALAGEMKNSEQYRTYAQAREKAMASSATRAMVDEYHKLQVQAQAGIMSGKKDEELMRKLQKLGELLQMDRDASAFLIAEYRLNTMLSDVFKILGEAVDIDFGKFA